MQLSVAHAQSWEELAADGLSVGDFVPFAAVRGANKSKFDTFGDLPLVLRDLGLLPMPVPGAAGYRMVPIDALMICLPTPSEEFVFSSPVPRELVGAVSTESAMLGSVLHAGVFDKVFGREFVQTSGDSQSRHVEQFHVGSETFDAGTLRSVQPDLELVSADLVVTGEAKTAGKLRRHRTVSLRQPLIATLAARQLVATTSCLSAAQVQPVFVVLHDPNNVELHMLAMPGSGEPGCGRVGELVPSRSVWLRRR